MLLRRLEVSVAAALAAAFAILAVLTTVPAVAAWDLRIDVAVNALVATDSALLTVGFAVTAVGSPVVVDVLTAIAVIAVGVRGDRAWRAWRARAAPYLAAARLVELGVETGLKHLADRHRPLLPHPLATRPGRSFPSGHTAAPQSCASPHWVLAWPRLSRAARGGWTGGAAVAIAAVGASRVLLGVHYLTDVLGGALLGTATALALSPMVTPVQLQRRR